MLWIACHPLHRNDEADLGDDALETGTLRSYVFSLEPMISRKFVSRSKNAYFPSEGITQQKYNLFIFLVFKVRASLLWVFFSVLTYSCDYCLPQIG